MFNRYKQVNNHQTFDGLSDRSVRMKWRLIRSLDYRTNRGNKPNGLETRNFELQYDNPRNTTFGTIHGGTRRHGWYAEWCYYGEKYPDWERYPNLKMWWFEEPPYDSEGNPLRPNRVWEWSWISEDSYNVPFPPSVWKRWPVDIGTVHDFKHATKLHPLLVDVYGNVTLDGYGGIYHRLSATDEYLADKVNRVD